MSDKETGKRLTGVINAGNWRLQDCYRLNRGHQSCCCMTTGACTVIFWFCSLDETKRPIFCKTIFNCIYDMKSGLSYGSIIHSSILVQVMANELSPGTMIDICYDVSSPQWIKKENDGPEMYLYAYIYMCVCVCVHVVCRFMSTMFIHTREYWY